MSVSTSSWTVAVAVAIFAVPVPVTNAGSSAAIEGPAAAKTAASRNAIASPRTPGSVAIHTRKLDLDKLVLADFGDEPSSASR